MRNEKNELFIVITCHLLTLPDSLLGPLLPIQFNLFIAQNIVNFCVLSLHDQMGDRLLHETERIKNNNNK